jgi:hypothetical protein
MAKQGQSNMRNQFENRLCKLEAQSVPDFEKVTAVERWIVTPITMQRRLYSTTYVETATEPSRTVYHLE